MSQKKSPIAVFRTTVATADLYFCRALQTLTTEQIIQRIKRFAVSKKLIISGIHQIIWIGNGAVCITIVLKDYHVIFTTYPERLKGFFVQVDVVFSNYKDNNFNLTNILLEGVIGIFNPIRVGHKSFIQRGPGPQIIASVRDNCNLQWQEMSSNWLCQTTKLSVKRRFP